MKIVTLRDVTGPDPRTTDDGAVLVDWWCDLACPDCAAAVEMLDELRERFGDVMTVRLRSPGRRGRTTSRRARRRRRSCAGRVRSRRAASRSSCAAVCHRRGVPSRRGGS
jgi:predicted DsbA family dithiol-disulfide isomerase